MLAARKGIRVLAARKGHLYAILHHLSELEVTLIERSPFNLMQLLYGIFNGRLRQRRVDAPQRLVQHIVQQRIAVITLYVWTVLVVKPKSSEQLYQSLLKLIF